MEVLDDYIAFHNFTICEHIFMQAKSWVARRFRNEMGIECLSWLAPDWNPIEHIWNELRFEHKSAPKTAQKKLKKLLLQECESSSECEYS